MEFDLNQFIKDIRSITRALSLERVLKIFLITFISMIIIIIFERKNDIYNAILEPLIVKSTKPLLQTFELSDANVEELQKLLQNFPAVNSVAVIAIDIRQNTKTVMFKNSDKKISFILSKIPDSSPLFTENGELNNRTVFLMGGEVQCMVTTKENLGAVIPEIEKIIPFSCAIPIPPTYRDFSGWIFVGFDRQLSDTEYNKFKVVATKISADIKRGA